MKFQDVLAQFFKSSSIQELAMATASSDAAASAVAAPIASVPGFVKHCECNRDLCNLCDPWLDLNGYCNLCGNPPEDCCEWSRMLIKPYPNGEKDKKIPIYGDPADEDKDWEGGCPFGGKCPECGRECDLPACCHNVNGNLGAHLTPCVCPSSPSKCGRVFLREIYFWPRLQEFRAMARSHFTFKISA